MRYRLQICCFYVYESLKRDSKKENDEIKKCKITRKNQKTFFEMLQSIMYIDPELHQRAQFTQML